MIDKDKIESILAQAGFSDYCWIGPQDITVSQWVRVKCMFGCGDYGSGACPPNTPEVEQCRQFFSEYNDGLIVRFTKFANKGSYPSDWSKDITNKLLEIEKQIFLMGFPKVFLLNQTCCGLCKDCRSDRTNCRDKRRSRPSPEGFAVDVYQTARNAGMNIHVITENPSEINRFAIMMID